MSFFIIVRQCIKLWKKKEKSNFYTYFFISYVHEFFSHQQKTSSRSYKCERKGQVRNDILQEWHFWGILFIISVKMLNPKTIFWTNMWKNSFDLFLKNTSLDHLSYFFSTQFFLTQFYNVKWVKKKLLNLVFGWKMGTHRNEMNGKNCILK